MRPIDQALIDQERKTAADKLRLRKKELADAVMQAADLREQLELADALIQDKIRKVQGVQIDYADLLRGNQ